jgi:integrase
MGRPPLKPGNHGAIHAIKSRGRWEARTRICDLDGVTRQVRRFADTKQAASEALQDALKHRPGAAVAGELTPATPFTDVATAWMGDVDDAVTTGRLAPNTARVYRGVLRRHLKPALGEAAISTITVTRADGFLRAFRANHKAALVKTVRTVLNGVLGYATRHGLIPTNPMRDVGRIGGDPRKKVRALTDTERERWLAKLDDDPRAVRDDLPELTRFMLATGCRVGEAIALHWENIHVDDKTVDIHWGIVRLENGGGLARTPTKTAAGERTLFLPGWAVDMLRARQERVRATSGPVFPPPRTGRTRWRDPSNTLRSFRGATSRAGFGWVTSHVFRKTVASLLHEAGLSDREVADHLGHANTRTLEHYIGRRATGESAAAALDVAWAVSGA